MSTPTPGSTNMEVEMGPQEMAMLSNLLAAYTFIADQPERTALVFLGGVCVGLLVSLCAIVFQIHCRADCHYGNSNDLQNRQRVRHHRRQHICALPQPSDGNPDSSAAVIVASGATGHTGDCESEDWDDTCDLSARRRRRFERALLNATMFTSAEGICQTGTCKFIDQALKQH
ncbi:hypothetical protein AMECASPLE_025002 [Ameca splendens]|uniref:EVA1 domain-containing protein n=1 Tax=Ameca splendens TaxID=208324 RepID=A0ABV0ZQS5_9TELE